MGVARDVGDDCRAAMLAAISPNVATAPCRRVLLSGRLDRARRLQTRRRRLTRTLPRCSSRTIRDYAVHPTASRHVALPPEKIPMFLSVPPGSGHFVFSCHRRRQLRQRRHELELGGYSLCGCGLLGARICLVFTIVR
jgi:hypothetical protein